jgi:hypothetical protein
MDLHGRVEGGRSFVAEDDCCPKTVVGSPVGFLKQRHDFIESPGSLHLQRALKNTGPTAVERIEGFEDSSRGRCHERCCRTVARGERSGGEEKINSPERPLSVTGPG